MQRISKGERADISKGGLLAEEASEPVVTGPIEGREPLVSNETGQELEPTCRLHRSRWTRRGHDDPVRVSVERPCHVLTSDCSING